MMMKRGRKPRQRRSSKKWLSASCFLLLTIIIVASSVVRKDKTDNVFTGGRITDDVAQLAITFSLIGTTKSAHDIATLPISHEYVNQNLAKVRAKHPSSHSPTFTHTLSPVGSRKCSRPVPTTKAILVFTLVDEANMYSAVVENFQNTALQAGGSVTILTFDQQQRSKLKTEKDFWEYRIQRYLQHASLLHPEDILIICDTDTIFLRPVDDMWQTAQLQYEFSNHDAVIASSELLCDTVDCEDVDTAQGRYLNAGMLLGTSKALVKLLKAASIVMRRHHVDDQAAYLYLSHRHSSPEIVLDYEEVLFKNFPPYTSLSSVEMHARRGGPYIVHFPGMRYGDDVLLNLCQRHLVNTYNLLLGTRYVEGIVTKNFPLVYVSLTTTPSRVNNLMPSLNSIFGQTYRNVRVILNLPFYSKRLNSPYIFPEYLKRLAEEVPFFSVERTEDFGPATKLLPTLMKVDNPAARIINVDDEYIYPPQMIEFLVRESLIDEDAAYGFAGQNVEFDHNSRIGLRVRSADKPDWNKHKGAVDILEAFLGVIYKRSFFDVSVFEVRDACFTADDIHISSHLASRGIPRIKIPLPFPRPEDNLSGNDGLSNLRSENMEHGSKNEICAAEHLDAFRSMWSVNQADKCPTSSKLLTFSPWSDDILRYLDPWWDITNSSRHSPCTTNHYTHQGSALLPGHRLRTNSFLALGSQTQRVYLFLDLAGKLCLSDQTPHIFENGKDYNACIGPSASDLDGNEVTHIQLVRSRSTIVWYARTPRFKSVRSIEEAIERPSINGTLPVFILPLCRSTSGLLSERKRSSQSIEEVGSLFVSRKKLWIAAGVRCEKGVEYFIQHNVT